MNRCRCCALVSLLSLFLGLAAEQAFAEGPTFAISPAEVKLEGNFAQAQLVVTRVEGAAPPQERSEDLTSQAKFESSDADVVSVEPNGLLLAKKDGEAKIAVTVGSERREIPVKVSGVLPKAEVKFSRDIRPILTKAGCAMAACHAAQHGQGGFKLSVFGFDPDADRAAMTRDNSSRRADFIVPEHSLLLLKPTAEAPHGGGKRIVKGSVDYQILRDWIAGGAPGPVKNEAEVKRLTVFPARRVGTIGLKQQLRVEAEYTDGVVRDVTAWARFDTTDDGVLTVTRDGLLTTIGKGQAAVMVRFEGQADISLVVVPYADQVELAGWQNNNFVDEHAAAKFRELGIEPSALCDDTTFIRRVFLDALGTLPTPEETKAFLASAEPNKRALLVDQALGFASTPSGGQYNEWYSAYWTLKWSDLLNNNSRELGAQGMWALSNWIRDSFRSGKPFDKFVRELVTAKGSIYQAGPANFYRIHRDSSMLTEATAQVFLGVRLECAECHHHPFEKYGQEDYYSLAAYFSRVGTKTSEEFGLFGGEQVILVKETGEVRHPKTNKVLEPKPLEGPPADNDLDRRIALADWLTAKDNQLFSRNVANRYVRYLLGRGLVEPVDDMRSTNPASNPPLLDALARHFVESNFSLKQLMRTIMQSRLYQLSSQPTEANAGDSRFFSHFHVKRLTAEPLADAIDRATGTQTKYKNLPLGTRAIELPDAEYPDYFLNTFAKPRRVSVCECERAPDPSLTQALHTLNGDTLANKIGDKGGRVAKLLVEKKPHEEIVKELYLVTLCREPSDLEMVASQKFLSESASPEECYHDLLWALLNSKQFLFVR
jgi:hypothetical protein